MPYATVSDAIREFAYNVGHEEPDRCWLFRGTYDKGGNRNETTTR